MRTTITVQFKSSLRKEFLDKLIKTSIPNLKEYDLWKFPFALEGLDEKPVWYLTAEHDNDFDIPSFLNVIKEIEAEDTELENGFMVIDKNLACLTNTYTKNLKLDTTELVNKLKLDLNGAKLAEELTNDVRKIKGTYKSDRSYTLVTSVKSKGYWTTTQVKDKVDNYFKSIAMQFENQEIDISVRGYNDDGEYEVTDGILDLNIVYPTCKPATFFIDISMSYPVFKALDREDFDKFLTNEITNKKPLVHSYHTALRENSYEVNFESTSYEEYMEIQAACRKIIDRDKLIPYHCVCGCEFEKPKYLTVKQPYEANFCYTALCPKCKKLCKTPMEAVK